MGEAETDHVRKEIQLRAHLVTYGGAADETVTHLIRTEIETMWNEPEPSVWFRDAHYRLRFIISAECRPDLPELEVLSNTNPLLNYFRIEDFVQGNISFVDGVNCNTGYFKKENLYEGSATAAHEFGHTLGLDHPKILDIRGMGRPGIMYPRGTWVDPEFQYDPKAKPGGPGGTMHPATRKVRQEDIDLLKIETLMKKSDRFVVGGFTSVYHFAHERGSAATPLMRKPANPWKRR